MAVEVRIKISYFVNYSVSYSASSVHLLASLSFERYTEINTNQRISVAAILKCKTGEGGRGM